ncbi:MAG: hypothetical protein ACYSSP_06760 [Planctomycetota bacterium]|jgi:hypothetical protein
MNIEQQKKFAVYFMGAMGILLLICSFFYGRQGNWTSFGMGLSASIMLYMAFFFSLMALKIDKRFDQLEKRLNQKEQTEKETTDS